MHKTYKVPNLLFLGFLIVGLFLSSCGNDDDDNGVTDEIQLLNFGPSPALRGSELKIVGTNLEQVSSIVLSENVTVSTFTSKTSELITLTIPEETVNGPIVLKTPSEDITSVTNLRISEPITISGFSPEIVKANQTLTISGDYLNLINTVIFSSNIAIGDSLFISHTREEIKLVVPPQAQTGAFILSDGAEMPIEIESEKILEVIAPLATSISPNPIRAGATITILGTDLDLVKQVGFEGTLAVSEFISQNETKIELVVPDDAKDGEVLLIPASFIEIPANEPLVMIVPQISSLEPNPGKNNKTITITGTDLDLTKRVIFGGAKLGFILNKEETELTARVPPTATEDVVILETAAEKQVPTAEILQLVQPAVTGFSPMLPAIGDELTIMGTDLDIISAVIFTDGLVVNTNNTSENSATVNIPVGALSGPITVIMLNGTEVSSSIDLQLAGNTNAVISSIPTLVSIGELIQIEGTELNEISEVIFPDNVSATMFGTKSDVLIEVFVPQGSRTGLGSIKFITFNGEEIISPEINIQGVDPVADPSLVFFNFDGLDSWWGDVGATENDPTLSLDGSNYFRVNQMLSGWNGFFWRNAGDNFPGAAIGTDIDDYVLKFDINFIEPMTGGSLSWRLKGTEGDFWYNYQPWTANGSFVTAGWITVTVPLSDFLDGTNSISDLNSIDSDFGVAFDEGDSPINIAIDNVRFEKL